MSNLIEETAELTHATPATETIESNDIKIITYQFIKLYQRWSEELQMVSKQGADIKSLIKLLGEQVEQLKKVQPDISRHIAINIQRAAEDSAQTISDVINKEAARSIENTTSQLSGAVEFARHTLSAYQRTTIATQWKVITVAAITTITTCVLVFRMLLPTPTLPLTSEQVQYLESGMMMEKVWPKLTKKEQGHLIKLANEVNHPQPPTTHP